MAVFPVALVPNVPFQMLFHVVPSCVHVFVTNVPSAVAVACPAAVSAAAHCDRALDAFVDAVFAVEEVAAVAV